MDRADADQVDDNRNHKTEQCRNCRVRAEHDVLGVHDRGNRARQIRKQRGRIPHVQVIEHVRRETHALDKVVVRNHRANQWRHDTREQIDPYLKLLIYTEPDNSTE